MLLGKHARSPHNQDLSNSLQTPPCVHPHTTQTDMCYHLCCHLPADKSLLCRAAPCAQSLNPEPHSRTAFTADRSSSMLSRMLAQMRVQGARTSPFPGMPPGACAHCCCCCSLCRAEGLPGIAGITAGYTAAIVIVGRPSATRGLRCGDVGCCWEPPAAALLPCCCCCCLRWTSAARSNRAGAAAPLGDAMTDGGGTVLRDRGAGRGVQLGSCRERRRGTAARAVRRSGLSRASSSF
jgi:hypothetical protein